MDRQPSVDPRRRAYPARKVNCRRHHESLVVVRVLADQIYPSRRAIHSPFFSELSLEPVCHCLRCVHERYRGTFRHGFLPNESYCLWSAFESPKATEPETHHRRPSCPSSGRSTPRFHASGKSVFHATPFPTASLLHSLLWSAALTPRSLPRSPRCVPHPRASSPSRTARAPPPALPVS